MTPLIELELAPNRPASVDEEEWQASLRRAREASARVVRASLTPPKRLKPSEWAAEHRILPETSAEPGPWRNERTPYLVGLMDAVVEPGVEGIVFQKSAQIGGSEALNNVLGYFIDEQPSPILFVQSNLDEARKYSKERIAPMINASPRLKARVAAAKSRSADDTLLSKSFIGGHLGITGAESPAGLRSRPRRVILADEVDEYPASAGTQGDPVDLARARTRTFWNSLIFLASTPKDKDASRIEHALQDCDEVRLYHVPCPHCLHFQVLDFDGLQWEKEGEGKEKVHLPETAQYACEKCGAMIPERMKRWMLENGKWIAGTLNERGDWSAGAPGRPRWVGFKLNTLYSPWTAWSKIVREFLKAKDHPLNLKVFVNTFLGETWDEEGSSLSADPFLARRESYEPDPVPERVLLITAGVDVQANRFEVELVGWGLHEETWSLDYFQIMGDPSVKRIWEQLDQVLAQTFKHPSGLRLRISATCIDSGYETQKVYRYCKSRFGANVWAIKGVGGMGKTIWDRPSNRNIRKVPVFPVGVDTAKNLIYSHLRIERPEDYDGGPIPGYCHFPDRPPYDEEYFKQLTSEKKITRRSGKQEWVRKRGHRAEALDCRVYALAAYEGLMISGVNLQEIQRSLETGEVTRTRGRRVRSKGIDR